MRIRISSIVGLLLMIGGASIVGRVVKVISLKNSKPKNDSSVPDEFDVAEPYNFGDSVDDIFWFMQITDLHLSIFHDQSRISSLRDFAKVTVDVINPSVVLVSGDLTDAKDEGNVGSRQYIEEWKIYQEILVESNVTDRTIWMDIRGNHDNFDVPELASSNNYYQYFSNQGQKYQRSYMLSVQKSRFSVAFVGVDACPLPGPKRPFNFIGILPLKEMDALRHYSEKASHHNYTIWFGHYPTSCILSPEPGISSIMSNGLVYLCGHLHTLGGFVPHLYTRQHTGSLELELGDWKDDRWFRIAAIDNGLFSFIDVQQGDWPVILVTNPKDAQFSMPEKEPLELMRRSNKIRILVWSSSKIFKVKVRLHHGERWREAIHVDGPLYTLVWNPGGEFSKGIHKIEVFASDSNGREKILIQPFSLDGSELSFHFINRIILMSNVSNVFQFLFGVSIFICVIPLCLVKYIQGMVIAKKIQMPRFRFSFFRVFFRSLWLLCSIDWLFWPLVIYAIYIPFGPWFIGEIMEDHVGVVFSWGIFVYSSYLPGSLTYLYGCLQMILFQLPLIMTTAFSAHLRYERCVKKEKKRVSGSLVLSHCIFFFLVLGQSFQAYYFWLSYGTMAFIFGPLRTWAVFLALYLWCGTTILDVQHLRDCFPTTITNRPNEVSVPSSAPEIPFVDVSQNVAYRPNQEEENSSEADRLVHSRL